MRLITIAYIALLVSCASETETVDYTKVDSLQMRNEYSKATGELQKMYDRNAKDSDLAFRLAHSLTYSGTDLDEITELLHKSIELNPNNDKARFVRAQGHMFNGDFGSAIRDLKHLSDKNPKLPMITALLTQALLMNNDLEDCKSLARKALQNEMPIEDAELIYKANILANYFLGHMDTASWDTAFLPDRGFRKDTTLARLIYKKELVFEDFAIGKSVRMNALIFRGVKHSV